VADVVEVFEVVHGNLVFNTQNRCDQAEAAVRAFLSRPAFKDAAEQVIFQVPSGKYGTGATLVVTVRFTDKADADECWAAAASRWNFCINGSAMYQTTVTQDEQAGTASGVIVHKWSKPVAADDVA
jgi:hypothetical protein